jgi:hypothetical protein
MGSFDIMSLIIALGIAGACVLLAGVGLGVFVVAWGSYVAWGLPVSVVVTTFYIGWKPLFINWPWKKGQ